MNKGGSVIANGSRVNGTGRAVSGSVVAGEEDVEDDEDDAQENLQGEESNEADKQQEARALQYVFTDRICGYWTNSLSECCLKHLTPSKHAFTINTWV